MADCGVYLVRCIPSGRVYVGSSVSMQKRFWEHRAALRAGRHHSYLLQRAWDKHGESEFEFVRLLWCAPGHRIGYEQAAMDAYMACEASYGMNISRIASGSPPSRAFLGRTHSEESRQLISQRRKGQAAWNKGLPSARKGIPRDPATKQKMREAKRKGSSATIDIEMARKIRGLSRSSGQTTKAIALELGVSLNVAYRVVRGISWVEAA